MQSNFLLTGQVYPMLMSSVPQAWGKLDRKSNLFKLIVKFFLKGGVFMFWHDIVYIDRAIIDLEPKIRTAEENLSLLPKKKTIVFLHDWRQIIYLPIYLQELFASAMFYSRLLVIVMETVFFACLFLESIKC